MLKNLFGMGLFFVLAGLVVGCGSECGPNEHRETLNRPGINGQYIPTQVCTPNFSPPKITPVAIPTPQAERSKLSAPLPTVKTDPGTVGKHLETRNRL